MYTKVWVVKNKDIGGYIKDENYYTENLLHALRFKTREDAREFIHDQASTSYEMPIKAVLLNTGSMILLDRKNNVIIETYQNKFMN